MFGASGRRPRPQRCWPADAADHGDPVALVLAKGDLPDGSGATLLQGVKTQHPDARRAMLIPGSLKRVASAVGEGSVVVSQVLRYLAEPT